MRFVKGLANYIKYVLNDLSLWQSMTKPQQTNEHMRKVINHLTHTHLLNAIKSILTQTIENFPRREFMARRLWKPVFLKQFKQNSSSILVWNRNKRLHTIYKNHVHKERKETTHVKIGERIVITTSSYIDNIISTRFTITK